jgi:AAA15 family ATPase/GTPase
MGDDYFIFTIEDGKVKGQALIAKHGDVPFSLSKESAGTIKLFKLGFLLYSHKNKGGSRILLLDEFDSLFHPFLTKILLKGLLNNPMGGQIIVALHNTMLLSHEVWRVDEIWFTEKDEEGVSRLYPLTDINPRFDKDLEKDYINGRYGAVPFLGGETLWQEIIK